MKPSSQLSTSARSNAGAEGPETGSAERATQLSKASEQARNALTVAKGISGLRARNVPAVEFLFGYEQLICQK